MVVLDGSSRTSGRFGSLKTMMSTAAIKTATITIQRATRREVFGGCASVGVGAIAEAMGSDSPRGMQCQSSLADRRREGPGNSPGLVELI